MEITNATHTTCACDHLTNFALLMVQKQTPEMQFFQYLNENNHHQGGSAAATDNGGNVVVAADDEDMDQVAGVSELAARSQLKDLADFKRILLRNHERILSKNWDFLSQREVRELSAREQEQVFDAWKAAGLLRDSNSVEKRQATDLVRNEFLRLKNFSRMRKMLVLIKNSLFWKIKRFNSTSPLRVARQINWRDLPKTTHVRHFLRSLIKFRDFLRDGKMDNEKVQHLDLLLTERQENAFLVRFLMLNENYMQRFVVNATTSPNLPGQTQQQQQQRSSFRTLNSFYIREQLNFLQTLRQQKKEDDKMAVGFADAKLLDEFRSLEKDDWFLIEDIRNDEIADNGLFDDGPNADRADGDMDDDALGGRDDGTDDNLFLFQLVRNNTTLRLFIYLSIVLCIAFIIVAIVLLKVYRGSMFKVRPRNGADQVVSDQVGRRPSDVMSDRTGGRFDGGRGVVGLVGGGTDSVSDNRAQQALGMRCVDVLHHHHHQHQQPPLPLVPLSGGGGSSSTTSGDALLDMSRGNSMRRSMAMSMAETDFNGGGGDNCGSDFEMKRIYNGSLRAEPQSTTAGTSSIGKVKKRKQKMATDWAQPPPAPLDDYMDEMEMERHQKQLSDNALVAAAGGRIISYPAQIFVNQHHHHLHHHLHTHTHYGAMNINNNNGINSSNSPPFRPSDGDDGGGGIVRVMQSADTHSMAYPL